MDKPALWIYTESEHEHIGDHLRNSYYLEHTEYTYFEDITSFISYPGTKYVFIDDYNPDITPVHAELVNNKNITWLIESSQGVTGELQQFWPALIKAYNVSADKAVVFTSTEAEIEMHKRVLQSPLPNFVATRFTEWIGYNEYLSKHMEKRFLFLNRNINQRRLFCFLDLMYRGILDNSYYSFHAQTNMYSRERGSPAVKESYENLTNMLNIPDPDALIIQKYWMEKGKEIYDNIPYCVPNEVAEVGSSGYQIMSKAISDAYNYSHMSLVVETNSTDNSKHFQFTEKTVKAMLARHPFFVYTNPNFLSRIKTLGFKTFSNYWDESYDTCTNSIQRIRMINDQVETLNNMPYKQFVELMLDASEVTTHNYAICMEHMRDPHNAFAFDKAQPELKNILKKTRISDNFPWTQDSEWLPDIFNT